MSRQHLNQRKRVIWRKCLFYAVNNLARTPTVTLDPKTVAALAGAIAYESKLKRTREKIAISNNLSVAGINFMDANNKNWSNNTAKSSDEQRDVVEKDRRELEALVADVATVMTSLVRLNDENEDEWIKRIRHKVTMPLTYYFATWSPPGRHDVRGMKEQRLDYHHLLGLGIFIDYDETTGDFIEVNTIIDLRYLTLSSLRRFILESRGEWRRLIRCNHCGLTVLPRLTNQRFCSPWCKRKWHKLH